MANNDEPSDIGNRGLSGAKSVEPLRWFRNNLDLGTFFLATTTVVFVGLLTWAALKIPEPKQCLPKE